DVGGLGDQHDVAEQREAAAEADGGPVDGGDDRHRAADHGGDDPPGLVDVLVAEGGLPLHPPHDAEVAAGAERAAGAGEHHGPRVVVGGDRVPDAGEGGVQLLAGGVELVGAVQLHQADRSAGGHHQVGGQVVHRGRLRSARTAIQLNAITKY